MDVIILWYFHECCCDNDNDIFKSSNLIYGVKEQWQQNKLHQAIKIIVSENTRNLFIHFDKMIYVWRREQLSNLLYSKICYKILHMSYKKISFQDPKKKPYLLPKFFLIYLTLNIIITQTQGVESA